MSVRARSLRLAAALFGALALLAIAPADTPGHAFLVKSTPAAGAVISHAPDRVRLWFNERLEAAFSTLTVVDGDGTRVDQGDVVVGPDDPRTLSVGLLPLSPRTYVVRYRVLSVDGHIVESRFSFTVRGRR